MANSTKAIHKYKLVVGEQQVPLPVGFTPLAFQAQNGALCLWCEVDPSAALEIVTLNVIGTGWTFDAARWNRYLGTTQQGPYVWHLFQGFVSVNPTLSAILEAKV